MCWAANTSVLFLPWPSENTVYFYSVIIWLEWINYYWHGMLWRSGWTLGFYTKTKKIPLEENCTAISVWKWGCPKQRWTRYQHNFLLKSFKSCHGSNTFFHYSWQNVVLWQTGLYTTCNKVHVSPFTILNSIHSEYSKELG